MARIHKGIGMPEERRSNKQLDLFDLIKMVEEEEKLFRDCDCWISKATSPFKCKCPTD